MQEEYVKTELKNLKKEMLHAQEEIKRIQSVPLVIGQFLEAVDQHSGIVGSTTGKEQQSTIDRISSLSFRFELLRSDSLHHRSRTVEDRRQCCSAQAFQCSGGHSPAGVRQQHLHVTSRYSGELFRFSPASLSFIQTRNRTSITRISVDSICRNRRFEKLWNCP